MTTHVNLEPRGGPLFVVRWVMPGGRHLRQSYYRREASAAAYARKRLDLGYDVEVYRTQVAGWAPVFKSDRRR